MEFFKKFKEKKKKKQASRGQFERIAVGDKTLPVLNLFTSKEDGKRYIELASIEELPELHFSEVAMEVILTTKKLAVKAGFNDAFSKGRFKIYKFEVLDINEYYI